MIGAGRDSWQTEHDFTRHSIWPFIPGHHMNEAFHLYYTDVGALEERLVYRYHHSTTTEDTTIIEFFFLRMVWVKLCLTSAFSVHLASTKQRKHDKVGSCVVQFLMSFALTEVVSRWLRSVTDSPVKPSCEVVSGRGRRPRASAWERYLSAL